MIPPHIRRTKKGVITVYKNYEELPCVLTPKDIEDILGISKNSAYELCHSKGFPAKKVGKLIRISKEKFIEWMNNTNNSTNVD